MATADDFDEPGENLEPMDDARLPRPAGNQWLMTRRLIEQAREKRELNKSLADFEDYVV